MTSQTHAATISALIQEYEAKFGIQGGRRWTLTADELTEAIKSGVANEKAPNRRLGR